MSEKISSFDTCVLARKKGFNSFKSNFKSALVDTRNYKPQRYSFYRDFSENPHGINLDIKGELEFDVPTNSSLIDGLKESYDNNDYKTCKCYLAPTQSALQTWLRDNHNIITEALAFYNEDQLPLTKDNIQKPAGYFAWDHYCEEFSVEMAKKFETYEDALEEANFQGLMLIKD